MEAIHPSVELGRGRSGAVYRCKDKNGEEIAHKVFFGDTITTIIHYIFSGAPNPYIWNKDAIHCAYYRRVILDVLCQYWFADKLRIAKAIRTGWSKHHMAYYLDAELIEGRPAALHHPFSAESDYEIHELIELMESLQQRLRESGFDGLVWQAGMGNPVAANNFLRESSGAWVWIDLESGVPALIPLNPWPLFTFYLPKSLYHRRPLFDDTDITSLQSYLREHRSNIEKVVGEEQYHSICEAAERLERHQNGWKSPGRLERGVTYHLKKGNITPDQASWYLRNPLYWILREFSRVMRALATKITREWPLQIWRKLAAIHYLQIFIAICKFVVYHHYRTEVAARYVSHRIEKWRVQKRLAQIEAQYLQNHLSEGGASSYITDFGVHIAIKPIVKTIEYWLLPLLFATGFVDKATLAVALVATGPIARSLYTLVRMAQSTIKGEEKPWVALLIGMFPVIGNGAYPAQMVYSAAEKNHVAEFILYDISTKFGKYFPIWGGMDTRTEHFFNRLPDLFISDRKPLQVMRESAVTSTTQVEE